ncbi:MAG: molecular chaperone DnaJ [Erysipelotrichaceae bacterium]|nr:molecular chaperone DnaJ [Erysipelotrichaceae bacterium]MDO5085536.1 molecular chaperone DnaJ [Erysipelotrichaceae bacterium]
MADKRDYYEILGLSKSASDQEIKKAYRQLAKKYHPDVNKEPGAEAKFKEINEAYEVLSDPTKKANYDQFGHAANDPNFGGFGGFNQADFGDFSDIFGSFFGGGFSSGASRNSNGPRRGQDRYMQMKVTFNEAVFGVNKTIKLDIDEVCDDCHGSGAYSKDDIKVCDQCKGTGRVVTQQRTPFGVFQSQSVCSTCNGTGKKITRKCKKCHGEGSIHKHIDVEVKIPAGVDTGQQLRISGKGYKGSNGGPNGDLYIEIIVARHEHFMRDGKNIFIKIPISAIDAALGTSIDIPTVHGEVTLQIPAGTQPNQQFRLKNKGIKDLRSSTMGDQYVEVLVEIPTKLSKSEKELYEKLKAETKKEGRESVFEKFKKAFK